MLIPVGAPSRMYISELPMPKWRNWQTRYIQGVVPVREWRFESSLRHQSSRDSGKNTVFASKKPPTFLPFFPRGVHDEQVAIFFSKCNTVQSALATLLAILIVRVSAISACLRSKMWKRALLRTRKTQCLLRCGSMHLGKTCDRI